jgi:hypothetical protein
MEQNPRLCMLISPNPGYQALSHKEYKVDYKSEGREKEKKRKQ